MTKVRQILKGGKPWQLYDKIILDISTYNCVTIFLTGTEYFLLTLSLLLRTEAEWGFATS